MDHFVDNEALDVTEVRRVRRITMRNLFVSIAEAFNLERGGIYTVKTLFKNPGKAAREYLGTKRHHYTPPFRLLIVTTAIMLFLLRYSDTAAAAGDDFLKGVDESSEMAVQKITEVFSNYFNLIIWSLIPIMAFISYLLNLKKNYNFAEHLVFQTFLFCLTNILSFLMPLDTYFGPVVMNIFILVVPFGYYVYGYKVFTGRSLGRSIWHCSVIYIIATVFWVVLGIILLVAYFKFAGIT
ncbi:MAG: DUF3667 domain-containing protein [Cryomorphaceae bacterium]|nr:DUF3667 domain-containing protein [Flavobacteriales bacterium]